jgi:aryl-alcohol dehydrogenase-like predicted oxidoreductase
MATDEDAEQVFSAGGAMETLIWAKKEGLIRNIGFSTHSEDVALKILDRFDFDTVLFPFYFAMGLNIGWGDRIAPRVKETGAGLLAMKTLIHRAWLEGESKGPYPKSWCKPFFKGQDELAVAAMKYGLSKGAATLIPPGNFEHFTFMLDHIDEVLAQPLTPREEALLRAEAEAVKAHPIF